MNQTAKDYLITAQLLQNAAAKLLEYTKHEVNELGKKFLDQQLARLDANKRHLYTKITTDEGLQVLRKELNKKDALQYANIFLTMMEFEDAKRDTIEKLVMAIQKGEMIEYVAP